LVGAVALIGCEKKTEIDKSGEGDYKEEAVIPLVVDEAMDIPAELKRLKKEIKKIQKDKLLTEEEKATASKKIQIEIEVITKNLPKR
jgi:hypothetical protein